MREVPFPRHELPMPPQQRIGRNDGVEFKQGFAPYRLGLARQKSTLSVCEPDALSSQPFFEQLILGLEKLDDEQLVPMDPARHNYKQKRQQWRHRTHASILPRPVVRIYGQRGMRQSAAGAATRFWPGEQANVPAKVEVDDDFYLPSHGWSMLGGDMFGG
jgi:hypothetical protein